jgi:hypothetical protein
MCSSPHRGNPTLPGDGDSGTMGPAPDPDPEVDDVTDPGPSDVPEADRAEQEAPLDQPGVSLAAEASPPPEDVPEADALEQQLAVRPDAEGAPLRPVGDREADDADVLEQETDVPVDDDDVLT